MQTQTINQSIIKEQNFPFAEVFDVSSDVWLGGANDFHFMTQGNSTKSAVVMKKGGEIFTVSGASKALKHAVKVGVPASPLGKYVIPLFEIAMELRFQEKVNEKNDSFFKSLPVGESFMFVSMSSDKKASKANKAEIQHGCDKRSTFYPHSSESNDGRSTWYMERPNGMLLIGLNSWNDWQVQIQEKMKKVKLSAEEYDFSVGAINNELLRIAQAIGPKAKPHAFDVEDCFGYIQVGAWRIKLAQNGSDMMDIVIEKSGKAVSIREDLVSVRMAHHVSGGVFGRTYTYSELGARAFSDYQEAKKAK